MSSLTELLEELVVRERLSVACGNEATKEWYHSQHSALLEMMRRDWAVRVLDEEHKETNTMGPLFAELNESESWLAMGRESAPIGWSDTSADAARLVAALATYPSLPEPTRINLGACPGQETSR